MLEVIFSEIKIQPKPEPKPEPKSELKQAIALTDKKEGVKGVSQTAVVAKTIEQPAAGEVMAERRVVRRVMPQAKPLIATTMHEENAEANSVVEQAKSFSQKEQMDEPIDQDELHKIWQGFLLKLDSRPALKAAMKKTPLVERNHFLMLEVGSKIGEEEINKIKPELLSYLKKRLRNSFLELHIQVVEIEIEGKPISKKELYAAMKEKNQHLQGLISLLQLELDE